MNAENSAVNFAKGLSSMLLDNSHIVMRAAKAVIAEMSVEIPGSIAKSCISSGVQYAARRPDFFADSKSSTSSGAHPTDP